jgi:hypothetical protein
MLADAKSGKGPVTEEEETRERNEEIIDETDLTIGQGPVPPPSVQDSKYKLDKARFEAFSSIAKIFIILSFGIVAAAVLVGFVNPEISLKVLELIWEKLASVYLVIFGSLLGKGFSR